MWRSGSRRRGGPDPYVLLLFAQLARQIGQLEHKPPATLAIIAACFAAYYDELLPPGLRPPSMQAACLQPSLIIHSQQWGRLIWSAFLHADEMHLYYNMASFLYKGALLESALGTARFLALLAELLLLSHGLVVGLAALTAAAIPEYRHLFSSSCAVGFSAVIFALKVVLQHDAPGYGSVLGLTLPTRYLAWAELFLASALNPRASFLGHVSGIVAGILHVRVLAPGLAKVLRAWRRAAQAAACAAARAPRQQQRRAQRPRPPPPTAAPPNRVPGASTHAAAAAAAAAAQQRMAAAQQRGIPARRTAAQQGGGTVGGAGDAAADGSVARQPLSAEELRRRRLARFQGQ